MYALWRHTEIIVSTHNIHIAHEKYRKESLV